MNPSDRSRQNRAARLNDIRRQVGDAMHSAPIDVPDLTSAIMSRVDAERAFLAPSVRRRLLAVRWGLGGTAVLLALGLALTLRYAPDGIPLVEQPAPLTSVVRSLEERTESPLVAIRQTVQTVATSEPTRLMDSLMSAAAPAEPRPRMVAPPSALVLGPAMARAARTDELTPVGSVAGRPEFINMPQAMASAPVASMAVRRPVAGGPTLNPATDASVSAVALPLQTRWNLRNQSSDLRVHLSEIRSRSETKRLHPALLELDDTPSVK